MFTKLIADCFREDGANLILCPASRKDGIVKAFAEHFDLTHKEDGVYHVYPHYDNRRQKTVLYLKGK